VFTGIIQAVAKIAALRDQDGLRTFIMEFPKASARIWPLVPASRTTASA
jgi:riboflavin synthase alpha subunit